MVIFTPITQTDLPVFRNKNYRMVECCNGHVVFSFAQKGNALTIHFASDKIGLRRVKKALNAFCTMLFQSYEWLEMIYGIIDKDKSGVQKVARKCGFAHCADDASHNIYVRKR